MELKEKLEEQKRALGDVIFRKRSLLAELSQEQQQRTMAIAQLSAKVSNCTGEIKQLEREKEAALKAVEQQSGALTRALRAANEAHQVSGRACVTGV